MVPLSDTYSMAFSLAILIVLLPVFVVLLRVMIVLYTEGRGRHADIVRLQGGFRGVMTGSSPTTAGGLRDPRVAKGFVVDTKSGRIIAQGKTTDEYMSALLGK